MAASIGVPPSSSRALRVAGSFMLILACQPLAPAAHADDWVSVAKSDHTEVFVKPASLAPAGQWLAVRTRQNFSDPQPSAKQGKSFLSARNDYRIDCAQRRLAYKQIQAYAQADLQGEVVQKTKIGENNLKWMDAPASTVFGELLDYACSQATPAAAPTTKQ
jgi:hypothetical protein